MLSVWRGPVQRRLARLEPVFTQPLRPDWEALFSHPGAFQRKPPAEAPSPKVHHTENHTYCLMFLLSCCMLQLHSYYSNTEIQCWTLWQKAWHGVYMQPKSNIFLCSHGHGECTIANILCFLSWHYSLQGNLVSLCVLFG